MRVIVYMLLFLNSFFVLGQKNDVAIKIYLEDAYSGKNITDAKVTLEGFEIPQIIGQYDKKGKFYYFTEIPEGYNTVMAYHQKYNEKGFQDVYGLPSRISLKLFNPLNVSYSFEQDSYKSPTQKIYVEDPYKFGITSNKNVDYNTFREYLFNELEKLGLELELVNPFLELEKNEKIPKKFKGRLHSFTDEEFYKRFNFKPQREAYPFISKYPFMDVDEFILPLLDGISSYDTFIKSNGLLTLNLQNHTVVFYVRKKNGEKFKRYNDPFLKRIRTIKDINTFSVLYNKYDFISNKKERVYKNRYSRYLDELNNFKDIDSSKIFYYFRIDTISDNQKLAIPYVKLEFHDFNMFESLKKEYESSSKLDRILRNEKTMFFDNAIGLGMLDQYERIGDSLKLNED